MGVGLRGCWSLVGPPRTPVNTNPDSRSGWNRPVHYNTNLKANDYSLLFMNHYLLSGTHNERCFHCHCVRAVHTNHRGSPCTTYQPTWICQMLYARVYLSLIYIDTKCQSFENQCECVGCCGPSSLESYEICQTSCGYVKWYGPASSRLSCETRHVSTAIHRRL